MTLRTEIGVICLYVKIRNMLIIIIIVNLLRTTTKNLYKSFLIDNMG